MTSGRTFISRLRARRWLLLIALIPALVVALATSYKVDGAGLHEKDLPYSTSSAQIYIDQAQSALGDATVVPEALANRAQVYVQLGSSRSIIAAAAKLAGVSYGSFVVQAVQLSEGASAQSLSSGPTPAVFLSSGGGAPLVNITTQAPEGALAEKLANGMSRALREFVLNLQREQKVPRDDQIRLRQLGSAQSGAVVPQASKRKVAQTALAAWAALAVLILAIDYLVRQGRAERAERAEASEPADEAPGEPVDAPETVST